MRAKRAETGERLIVRIDPNENVNATSKRREFEVINLMQGRIPIPRAEGVDPDCRYLSEQALGIV